MRAYDTAVLASAMLLLAGCGVRTKTLPSGIVLPQDWRQDGLLSSAPILGGSDGGGAVHGGSVYEMFITFTDEGNLVRARRSVYLLFFDEGAAIMVQQLPAEGHGEVIGESRGAIPALWSESQGIVRVETFGPVGYEYNYTLYSFELGNIRANGAMPVKGGAEHNGLGWLIDRAMRAVAQDHELRLPFSLDEIGLIEQNSRTL